MGTGEVTEYDWEALRRESQAFLKLHPDAKYLAPGNSGLCFYNQGEVVEDGEMIGVGCFFGQVFHSLGYHDLMDSEVSIVEILETKFEPDVEFHSEEYKQYHDFYVWADEMQARQDNGLTWSEANAHAEEKVWGKYNGEI